MNNYRVIDGRVYQATQTFLPRNFELDDEEHGYLRPVDFDANPDVREAWENLLGGLFTCPWCKRRGTTSCGYVDNEAGDFHKVADCSVRLVKWECERCLGKGEVINKSCEPCPACKGRGYMNVFERKG